MLFCCRGVIWRDSPPRRAGRVHDLPRPARSAGSSSSRSAHASPWRCSRSASWHSSSPRSSCTVSRSSSTMSRAARWRADRCRSGSCSGCSSVPGSRPDCAGLALIERRMRTRQRTPDRGWRHGGADGRAGGDALARGDGPGARPADRDDDRRRDRPPQLRRGPGDRRLGQHRRDRARDGADHRLRAPQRDRGIRHRRPARRRPAQSWSWLALAGLVGGGPVFLGAMVGYNVTSEPLELALLRGLRRARSST